MIELVHRYATDIEMELGNDKYALYNLKGGRSPGNEVPAELIDGRIIKYLCEGEQYTYLWIPQTICKI